MFCYFKLPPALIIIPLVTSYFEDSHYSVLIYYTLLPVSFFIFRIDYQIQIQELYCPPVSSVRPPLRPEGWFSPHSLT